MAYDAVSLPELRSALKIQPKTELYKQWLNREISFGELQKSLTDQKKREAAMEQMIDLDNHFLQKQMNNLYDKEIKAKQNWQMLCVRMRCLLAVARQSGVYPEREPISYAEYEVEQESKDAWYETGQYTISPLTIKYQIWDSLKSALYMASMFTFVFETAFSFDQPQNGFMFFFEICVDLIQLIDIVLTFFTGRRVVTLRYAVHDKFMRYKRDKKKVSESEKDQEWCVELQFLALEYLSTYFVFDFLAAMPSLVGLLFSISHLKFFRVFRVLRLQRLMQACDQLSEKLQVKFIRRQREVQNSNLILKASFKLSFLLHFSICFFIIITRYINLSSAAGLDYHLGMLELNDVSYDQTLESYVSALVFVMTTYTTIGYGEQNVVSPREKIMAMLFMVAGGFMLATIKDVIVNYRKQVTVMGELTRIKHEA